MPVENPNPIPPEQLPDDWQQLAHDAREWDLDHPGVAALYENHVVPQLHSKGLGHLAITTKEKAGGQFLHEQNGGQTPLHKSGPIEFSVEQAAEQAQQSQPQKPAEKLAVYLKSISGRHSLIANTPDDPEAAAQLAERRDRQIRHRTVDPKVASIAHLKTAARIMYEQGQGSELAQMGIAVSRTDKGALRFDIPDELLHRPEIVKKGEEKQKVQADTLSEWVEYLNGKDTNYPDWFKYYAIDGVTKLGAFDKEKGRFTRRDSDSLAPFPRLSRGALAKVRSWVEVVRLDKLALPAEFDDEDKQKALKTAVSGGNFGQLYVLALERLNEGTISDELRKVTDGTWKTYQQGSDPAGLYGDLQGFGLDWCTSTDVYTAKDHVDGGDFHVFYSNDELGKPQIPRIAVRMYNGKVAEVRGIDPSQALEPIMADIASEKLQGLPGGEAYIQRAADMKHLTAIDKLLSKDPNAELSAEDVAFLYELNRTIKGFGYDDDPRVQELQVKAANGRTADLLEQIDATTDIAKRVRNQVRVRDLTSRASQDPSSEFSDEELSFIYGLDGHIQTLDPNDHELAKSIDYWHGGRDRERLLELMPAAFERQYQASLRGYEATAQSLGIEAADTETLQREFATKLATWQEQGVYQYVLEQLIEKDTQFNLVMTPNVLASSEQIISSAEDFGQDQPMGTYIYRELYSQYSGEELSGTQEQGVSARFSLMPSKYTEELGSLSVEPQRTKLQQLQDRVPQLSIRVPSVLDAISYWQSLRARGDSLSGDGTVNKTLIRHFDLTPKRFGSWSRVPYSFVRGVGEPVLGRSVAEASDGARVLVG